MRQSNVDRTRGVTTKYAGSASRVRAASDMQGLRERCTTHHLRVGPSLRHRPCCPGDGFDYRKLRRSDIMSPWDNQLQGTGLQLHLTPARKKSQG